MDLDLSKKDYWKKLIEAYFLIFLSLAKTVLQNLVVLLIQNLAYNQESEVFYSKEQQTKIKIISNEWYQNNVNLVNTIW